MNADHDISWDMSQPHRDPADRQLVNDTAPGPSLNTPGTLDQANALERENPLPLPAPDIHELYEEPLTSRDRHLGLMALGQQRDTWG